MNARAREAATRCVYSVCENGASLDDALLEFEAGLRDSELSLYRALSYGGVRWYLAYKTQLDTRLKKPFKPKDRILYALLATALFQLDKTEQAPHAVVNESVKLAQLLNRKWAAGLINALLRAHLRVPASKQPEEMDWRRRAFPAWMLEQFEQAWPQYTDAVVMALQQQPPMTLRINTRKISRQAYQEKLAESGQAATECTDSPVGIELAQPTGVGQLPGFSTAEVSVQDESAQLVAAALDLQAGQRVLDGCAAPGGKSLHILEIAPHLATLDVLDLPNRLPRLRENIERAQASANIIAGSLLQTESWWNGELYDRILLDVPCTGTGVIRRHPDIKFRRQPENGLQFAAKQLDLLRHAWRMLKPGGKLLYTTCSILPQENEDCVQRFIAESVDAASLKLAEIPGLKTAHGRQRLPGVHAGDGFFYALLQKTK